MSVHRQMDAVGVLPLHRYRAHRRTRDLPSTAAAASAALLLLLPLLLHVGVCSSVATAIGTC